jgi:LysR family transcriptional regulator, nod-box dependent transcriptional activator
LRLHDLDLNLLVTLDALLTEQGVTRAAQRLNLTQPAISNALRRLREHFADELLVQLGRRMVPTPLAASLQQPIRDLLLQLEGLLLAKPSFDPARIERTVVIVASDYVVTVLLAPFLRRVARAAPGLAIDVVSPGDSIRARFRAGELDLAVVPEAVASPDHPRQIVLRDTYCAVVWEGNPHVGDAISRETLGALRHSVPGFGDLRPSYIPNQLLEQEGVRCAAAVTMPSFALAIEAIVGTEHVTTVPRRLADVYARRLPLKLMPCPVKLPPIVCVLQWHRHRERDPLTVWLRGQLLCSADESEPETTPRPQPRPGPRRRRRRERVSTGVRERETT